MTLKPTAKISSSKTYKLTSKNYYDNESNWHYQSVSLIKDFEKCQAATLARLKGEYEPDGNNTALLVGNFLHSFFESPKVHDKFIKDNLSEIQTKAGKARAEFKQAETMIKTLDSDQAFRALYQGKKEVIVTGKIGGVDFMGKIDCLNLDKGYFVDLKTTRNIRELQWDNVKRRKVSFIEKYNYYIQLAVYQELIKQQFGVICRPMIIAVSKEPVPDKQAFVFEDFQEQTKLSDAMSALLEELPEIEAVKNGQVSPEYCGVCDYCKSHKHLSIMSPTDLEYM